MKLSDEKIEIIDYRGNLLVKASAGAGKTTTMVKKITKEIDENLTHKKIAAITFTIKAANEIKDRMLIDTGEHFIGTNNSFAINEVVNPFFSDVFGSNANVKFSVNYNEKISTFQEGINKIRENNLIGTYRESKKNFIFELARYILINSRACKRYIQSKYFKIYIDEYQDSDFDMHNFFMHLCDECKIEIFAVGDDKQSIYRWRGAYPEIFDKILKKESFHVVELLENHRSALPIQNYSNSLFKETAHLFDPSSFNDNVFYVTMTQKRKCISNVLLKLDMSLKTAIIRFTNEAAQRVANECKALGYNFEYIPTTPIDSIANDATWFFIAIARYRYVKRYSIYDFISEIPTYIETPANKHEVLREKLDNIISGINDDVKFQKEVKSMSSSLDIEINIADIEKLHSTLKDAKFQIAFNSDELQNVAMTLHSSKGLEYEQVIVYAMDYNLSRQDDIHNHYVAITRAKSKLIIVNNSEMSISKNFFVDLHKITKKNGIEIGQLMKEL